MKVKLFQNDYARNTCLLSQTMKPQYCSIITQWKLIWQPIYFGPVSNAVQKQYETDHVCSGTDIETVFICVCVVVNGTD